MFERSRINKSIFAEILILGLIFVLMLVLTSCKHQPLTGNEEAIPDEQGNNNTNNTFLPCDPDTVYFSNIILPLFISNCAKSGCHDNAGHQDGIILNSYASIMASGEIEPYNPWEGDIPEVITENDPDKVMPPPGNTPLTPEQINLILTWISQGAQSNYCTDCDTSNVTYSGKIKLIIDLKCKGCHSGSNPPLGINLSTYAGLQGIALTGALMGSITHQTGYFAMPKNSPSLPQCEIDAIRIWVNDGAPNN